MGVVLLVLIGLAAHASSALAYLKLGFEAGGDFVLLRWKAPVRYSVTDQDIPGVSASEFQAAVNRAFDTWQAVPTATIEYEFTGFTSALPGDEDGRSTLGFRAAPDLDRVLAATSFLVDAVTGEVLESDVFFNTVFDWSVAADGEAARYDVETIALHEIGHLSGLGHSALGETELSLVGRRVTAAESVMFPIAFRPGGVSNRSLRPDDIAGLSDIYPDSTFKEETGSVSGRVLKSGQGVYGAHVVAFSPRTGALVGTFSLNDLGRFAMAGLEPGPYILRVEPLDDADVESFFEGDDVDVDFRAGYYDRFVVVPRGGNARTVDVTVMAK
jgi:hypothetical protein